MFVASSVLQLRQLLWSLYSRGASLRDFYSCRNTAAAWLPAQRELIGKIQVSISGQRVEGMDKNLLLAGILYKLLYEICICEDYFCRLLCHVFK